MLTNSARSAPKQRCHSFTHPPPLFTIVCGTLATCVYPSPPPQFGSVCMSVVTRLMMKTTVNILTESELILSANLTTVLISLIVSVIDSSGFGNFADAQALLFDSGDHSAVGCVLYLGIACFTIAAYYQIVCARALGPGLYDSFYAVRVLVAILQAMLFRGEGIHEPFTWAGKAIALVAVSKYAKNIHV